MTVNIKNWQELKKPNSLEIKPGADPKLRATFVAALADPAAVRWSAGQIRGPRALPLRIG